MLHIPAMILDPERPIGVSPILQASEVFGGNLALQKFANKFFGSGANLSGILQTDQVLTKDAMERLRDSFVSKYAGIDKSHKIAVLEQGMKYTRIGIEPEAAQFLESRKFSVQEIARWFRVPPHMLADLDRATFSNIEHQSIEFVMHTLRPWLVRWEQELNRKLFTVSSRQKYFIEFNIEGMLRGDAVARADFYNKLWNMGAISQNEIRTKENLPPIPEGNKYYVPLNMVDGNKPQVNE
jgi:HK97 family phage portal protein